MPLILEQSMSERYLPYLHMGLEHASREKKFPMVNFLIFVHKNVHRIRFQEIKIRPLKGFEKFAFWFFAHYKISPSKGPKYP